MPYTENSTWKSCQWIGYKVSCCQRNCQSAVLHAHFNSYSCCPCIFYMENFCCKEPKHHTTEIVDCNNTKDQNSAV